jgi:CspA family cold shock protein
MEETTRALGTVQWFSRVKGYGFIRPDGQEEDVFVHYSVINGDGYRNLSKGQRVEFVVEDTPKGPQAVDVVGLDTIVEVEPAEEDTPKEPQAMDVVGLDTIVEVEPAEEDTPKEPQAVDVVGLDTIVEIESAEAGV